MKAPVQNSKIVPEQAGSCKDLSARCISNIDVKANTQGQVDYHRDNDGIACEAN